MTTATFTPHTFDRNAEYEAALLALIASARRELRLFEKNFAETGLSSRAFAEALARGFAEHDELKVTLLALEPDHIAAHCPRILDLRETWSHRFTMLRITQAPELWHAGFAIADNTRYVKRHHFDWPRGETSDDGRVIAGLNEVWDNLLQYAEVEIAWQRLRL
ncbi:DUF7931 domain-containing protein [Chitinolyticbacter meiyuanensis]|uniref:DUF7931 domain-containing protein n=1 Tax=Chitinolyticbacter meiyuanensis TaxID=682798 RepID=UPI0011E5A171|nr:hypothetical protein [Chitinolyticbacter meiyuanensis]